MPDTYSPNYNLTIIEIGQSRNTWGQKTNANMTALDTAVKAVDTTAKAGIDSAWANAQTRVSRSGDTMTGPLTAPTLAVDPNFLLNLGGANSPSITWSGGGNYAQFDRPSRTLSFVHDGAARMAIAPGAVNLAVPLTLPANPTSGEQASNKAYVDQQVSIASANANGRLSTAGGTIAGSLQVNGLVLTDHIRFRSDGAQDTGISTAGDGVVGVICDNQHVASVTGAGMWHRAYGNVHEFLMRRDASLPFISRPMVQAENPRIALHWPGIINWNQWVTNDSHWALVPSDNYDDWRLRLSPGGDLTARSNVWAASDARLKTEVAPISDALSKVLALAGKTYKRIDLDDNRTHLGLIAQEVQQIVPEVVNSDAEGMLSVSYASLVPLLIEAIRELAARG